jgi:hypothetical protein
MPGMKKAVQTRAPRVSDPSWEIWSAPVRVYLALPRTWPAMMRWCRERPMNADRFRHCLAWLEGHQMAYSFTLDDIFYWVGADWNKKSLPPDKPEGDPLGK